MNDQRDGVPSAGRRTREETGFRLKEIEQAAEQLGVDLAAEDVRSLLRKDRRGDDEIDLGAEIKRLEQEAEQRLADANQARADISRDGYWRGASRAERMGFSGAMASRASEDEDIAWDLLRLTRALRRVLEHLQEEKGARQEE
jgi:hypothetical protein